MSGLFNFSPLAKRRFAQFRQNRRGWYALWLVALLFLLVLPAEFIANDRPLLVKFGGHFYSPVLQDYPETQWGGDFPTATNYRDPYIRELMGKDDNWSIWPLIPFRYDTINYDLTAPAPTPPSAQNWLGTDDQGRDVLARLIYGFRISLLFGLALTILASVVGIAAGAVQGYFGGWVDLIAQRVIEIWSGMPALFLLIIMASIVQPSFGWLLGLLLLFFVSAV